MVKSVINTLSVQGKLHASYKQLQKDAKTGKQAVRQRQTPSDEVDARCGKMNKLI